MLFTFLKDSINVLWITYCCGLIEPNKHVSLHMKPNPCIASDKCCNVLNSNNSSFYKN